MEATASLVGAGVPGQRETSQKPTLKEQVLEIPPQTLVEVRLRNKEKLRGRLGEVTDEGFSLQAAKADKIETHKIAFSDVKSIKKVEGRTAAKTAG